MFSPVMMNMQFSIRTCMIALTAVAFCTALAGRVNKSGSLVVNQHDLPYVETVLAEHRITDWTCRSSLGGSLVTFHSPIALTSVDQYLIQDAEVREYYLEIRYNAIIPLLSSTRIVNPETGIRATSAGRLNRSIKPICDDR